MQIYVINLDRHRQRLARMSELLAGLPFERIPAVDGSGLEGPRENHGEPPTRFEDMTCFQRACSASHEHAWRKLLDSDASHACILEDDVILSPDFSRFVARTDWIPEECDVVKIETYLQKLYIGASRSSALDRGLVRVFSTHAGTAGYVISRSGAAKMLECSARPPRPLDLLMFDPRPLVSGLRLLQLDPALCIQMGVAENEGAEGEFASSIQVSTASKRRRSVGEKFWIETARPFQQLWTRLRYARSRPHRRKVMFN